jgi:hypothetical protein
MDLLQLKKARETQSNSHSILVYGDSGSGKTRFVATAAEIPEIRKIVWIDLENGKDTILNQGLSDAALQKIQLISMYDTRKDPYAMNTMLRMFSSSADISLCEEHGRMNCLPCTQGKKPFHIFNMTKLTHSDLVVIDSGSQLSDCGVNALLKGQPDEAILQIQEWGTVNNWLKSILQVVQACRYTNYAVISHVLYDEEYQGTGPNKVLLRTRQFPLIGTKNFSTAVGKYFGTIVHLEVSGKKHKGGSSTTYRQNIQTKSRLNVSIEESASLDMRDILIKGGILGKVKVPTSAAV